MKNNYRIRINKALNHIDANLKEDINVKRLAELCDFSLYHFHRIFKSLTGETPYDYLLRLRLEKAVFLLKYEKTMKVADIGYQSGFSSAENFSRQFKSRFNISPSVFRKNKNLHNSRIYQEHNPHDFYLRIENSRKQKKKSFAVTIESLSEISIAYIKAVFGEDGSGMIEKYLELMNWAEQNQVNIKGGLTRFGMSIDNPEVTPASKFRYDFALAVNKEYPAMENIEYGLIPKADYATVHVQGTLEDVAQGWDMIYHDWLPNSGYLPLDYPAIEEFMEGPEDIGWETFNLKCRVPIIKE